MSEMKTLENLMELGESEYQLLKEIYCRLQGLRTDINAMHDQYTADGKPPLFDQVEAAHLQVEELVAELDRFLLPVCTTCFCSEDMCEL